MHIKNIPFYSLETTIRKNSNYKHLHSNSLKYKVTKIHILSPNTLFNYFFYFRENIEIGGATKVFICDDFVGQNYLCYLQPSKFQLSLVKADFSCEIYTFGMLTSISALDAVPVPVSFFFLPKLLSLSMPAFL